MFDFWAPAQRDCFNGHKQKWVDKQTKIKQPREKKSNHLCWVSPACLFIHHDSVHLSLPWAPGEFLGSKYSLSSGFQSVRRLGYTSGKQEWGRRGKLAACLPARCPFPRTTPKPQDCGNSSSSCSFMLRFLPSCLELPYVLPAPLKLVPFKTHPRGPLDGAVGWASDSSFGLRSRPQFLGSRAQLGSGLIPQHKVGFRLSVPRSLPHPSLSEINE